MPSTSAKQARTMQAAARDPMFAKKMGIPQSVAREYAAADEKKGGGTTCPMPMHKSHDEATKCPTPKHDSHNAPTHVPGPRQGQRRY